MAWRSLEACYMFIHNRMNRNREIFNSLILSERKSRFRKFMHVTKKLGLPEQRPSDISRR